MQWNAQTFYGPLFQMVTERHVLRKRLPQKPKLVWTADFMPYGRTVTIGRMTLSLCRWIRNLAPSHDLWDNLVFTRTISTVTDDADGRRNRGTNDASATASIDGAEIRLPSPLSLGFVRSLSRQIDDPIWAMTETQRCQRRRHMPSLFGSILGVCASPRNVPFLLS